jgi:hypothetical protein
MMIHVDGRELGMVAATRGLQRELWAWPPRRVADGESVAAMHEILPATRSLLFPSVSVPPASSLSVLFSCSAEGGRDLSIERGREAQAWEEMKTSGRSMSKRMFWARKKTFRLRHENVL